MKKILIILVLSIFLLPASPSLASDTSSKLKGRILLQVESKGEAWYISPDNSNRYALGRPADAFKVMRELGLGISNKDFELFKNKAPIKLSGKILIKTEDSGKAYYVNPVDLKLYFLGKPSDAFKVMRELGLGINNRDLEKITISQKSKQAEQIKMAPIEYSGIGQRASLTFMLEEGLSIFTLTHKGQSNFSVFLMDSNGQKIELLANAVGSFNGSKAVEISKKGTYLFDISADGEWSIKIEQPRPITADVKPKIISGIGQKASSFIKLNKGLTTFDLKHDGTSNFSVFLMDSKGQKIELLANDIGSFNGSKAVGINESGLYLLDISADGNWSIAIK